MRMISGSVMSTPVQWLPVLSNIAPAYLLRNSASVKILDKIRLHLNLPVQVFKDIYEPPEFRLPSRRPIWSTMPSSDCSVDDAWREDWFKHDVPNQFLITDPTIRRPGSDLNRLWLDYPQPVSHWPWSLCSYSVWLGHTRWSVLCVWR